MTPSAPRSSPPRSSLTSAPPASATSTAACQPVQSRGPPAQAGAPQHQVGEDQQVGGREPQIAGQADLHRQQGTRTRPAASRRGRPRRGAPVGADGEVVGARDRPAASTPARPTAPPSAGAARSSLQRQEIATRRPHPPGRGGGRHASPTRARPTASTPRRPFSHRRLRRRSVPPGGPTLLRGLAQEGNGAGRDATRGAPGGHRGSPAGGGPAPSSPRLDWMAAVASDELLGHGFLGPTLSPPVVGLGVGPHVVVGRLQRVGQRLPPHLGVHRRIRAEVGRTRRNRRSPPRRSGPAPGSGRRSSSVGHAALHPFVGVLEVPVGAERVHLAAVDQRDVGIGDGRRHAQEERPDQLVGPGDVVVARSGR